MIDTQITAEITELTKEISVEVRDMEKIQANFILSFPDVGVTATFHPYRVKLMEEGASLILSLKTIDEKMKVITPKVHRLMFLTRALLHSEEAEELVREAYHWVNCADGIKLFLNSVMETIARPFLRKCNM